MTYAWLNGSVVPESDAKISVFDGGWLHGAGLFETMRAQNGHVFRLERHLARLRRSAEVLLHPVDGHVLPTNRHAEDLLSQNRLRDARLRLTVTAGSLREINAESPGKLTVCLTATDLQSYPTLLYEQGVHVVVSRYTQSPGDPLAGHKSTCYLARLLALRDAQRLSCAEALWFTTDRLLAEGCISNVFIAHRGELRTSPLGTPVLPGITREAVIELTRSSGIPITETPLTVNDVLDADEVMLTNSMMLVMPVARVEKHQVGTGRPGPLARRLLEELRKLVDRECKAE